VDEAGQRYTIDDPLARELIALQARAATMPDETQRAAALCAFAPVFGTLGKDPRFIETVAQHSAVLRASGVAASLST